MFNCSIGMGLSIGIFMIISVPACIGCKNLTSLLFIDGKTFAVMYVVSVVIKFLRKVFIIKTGL